MVIGVVTAGAGVGLAKGVRLWRLHQGPEPAIRPGDWPPVPSPAGGGSVPSPAGDWPPVPSPAGSGGHQQSPAGGAADGSGHDGAAG